MGTIYMLCVAMLFSFGGTCAKLISPYFAPSMISFMRFFFGVLWLLLLKTATHHPSRIDFREQFRRHWKVLLLGAVAKWGAYITENTGLSIGVSYGNILTQPAQIVLLSLLSSCFFGERLGWNKKLGIGLCVLGVLVISWNGRSLDGFLGENAFLTLLFVLSGCCAGLHAFSQKLCSKDFDILDSNLTIFSIASVLGFLPPLFAGEVLPRSMPDVGCVFGILFFGFITGMGFYLNAKAIALIPLHMVALLQSTMVFFSLLWGILFFHETVSLYILCGTITFVIGILLMQWKMRKAT